MTDFIEQLGDFLTNLGTWGYFAVGLIVFLETVIVVGQFLPGSVFLAFVGFLCYAQVFDLPVMVFVILSAHYLGELVNYALGARKGRDFFSDHGLVLRRSLLEKVEAQLQRWGPFYFILCQFSGVLRPILSFLAGASRYSRLRFAVWMIPACTIWTIVHLGAGFVLGAGWRSAGRYIEDFSLLLLVVLLCVALAVWGTKTAVALAGYTGQWLEQTGRRVISSNFYQECRKRYPFVFSYLERRLSLSRPWGWAATVRFALAGVLFFLVLLCGILALHSHSWTSFDACIANLFAQVRKPFASRALVTVTAFADPPWILASAALLAVVALSLNQKRNALLLVASPVLSSLLAVALKQVFLRTRPDMIALAEHTRYSFPSHHTAAATAFLLATLVWVWRSAPQAKVRIAWGSIVCSLALLVGYSRAYLGYHYVSDVLGGCLLGAAVTLGVSTVSAQLSWPEHAAPVFSPTMAALSILALMGSAAYRSESLAKSFPPPRQQFFTCQSDYSSLEDALPFVPRLATRVTGEATLAVNLVVIGELDQLEAALCAKGWRKVLPDAFYTHEIQAPIFPAFLNTRPADMTLERREQNERIVLRLWHLGLCVNKQRMWAGSMIREQLRQKFLGMEIFAVDPDIDWVREQWCRELSGLKCEELPNFRPRGLYRIKHPFFTHGQVACIWLKH